MRETNKRIKAYTTFLSSLGDDAVWDANDNLVVPGGQNVAEWICGAIKDAGLSCTQPSQYSFYGWDFIVISQNVKIWCLLQCGEPWILFSEPHISPLQRLFGKQRVLSIHEKFVKVLQKAFLADATISEVVWYTESEFQHYKG